MFPSEACLSCRRSADVRCSGGRKAAVAVCCLFSSKKAGQGESKTITKDGKQTHTTSLSGKRVLHHISQVSWVLTALSAPLPTTPSPRAPRPGSALQKASHSSDHFRNSLDLL